HAAAVARGRMPVRYSPAPVVPAYRGAAATAYVVVALGVIAGILPMPTLLILLSIPLALRVSRGLLPNYDNPYGLMAVMGVKIQLDVVAGVPVTRAYRMV